jgi:hypothetical protein
MRAPHPAFGHLLPASGEKISRCEIPRLAERGEGGAKRRVRGTTPIYRAKIFVRANPVAPLS